MRIVIFNGSPKGLTSVTMQYVHYIQKSFPTHEFKIINIAQQIKKIESDQACFQAIMEDVRTSDVVMWAFPLYILLVPAQYKRFIELINERSAAKVFKDKYAAILSTSIHFHDHAAHNYMRAVIEDLGMRFAGAYSAGMYDLVNPSERQRLLLFAQGVFETIERQAPFSRAYLPLRSYSFTYHPDKSPQPIATADKRILIITDETTTDSNMTRMTERLQISFGQAARLVNLYDIDIKGGCQGCIQCGYNNVCAYEGKDGYIDFYRDTVKMADIIVFAGRIVDRYLSSRFKLFFDRSFFHTHIPSLTGKQVAFLIEGPLRQIPNLRQIFEASISSQQANLVDFISDEDEDSQVLDELLDDLAVRLIADATSGYIAPPNYLAVGGTKIFRDEIWGHMRFVFQADHRYYRTHGVYDFPQMEFKTRALNVLMMALTRIPAFRPEFTRRIKKEMIKPLQKVLMSTPQD